MADVPSAGLDEAQNALVTSGTTYYMGLNTADPGQTGASEDTTGVIRQAVTFGASSGGTQASTNNQAFTINDANTFTHFSIWTAASGGTYVRGGALTNSLTPGSGGTVTFATGAVTFTAA